MLKNLAETTDSYELQKQPAPSVAPTSVSLNERRASFIHGIKYCGHLIANTSRRNDKTRLGLKLDRIATQCKKAFRKNDEIAVEKLKQELRDLFAEKKGEAAYMKKCRDVVASLDTISYLEVEIPAQHFQKSVMQVLAEEPSDDEITVESKIPVLLDLYTDPSHEEITIASAPSTDDDDLDLDPDVEEETGDEATVESELVLFDDFTEEVTQESPAPAPEAIYGNDFAYDSEGPTLVSVLDPTSLDFQDQETIIQTPRLPSNKVGLNEVSNGSPRTTDYIAKVIYVASLWAANKTAAIETLLSLRGKHDDNKMQHFFDRFIAGIAAKQVLDDEVREALFTELSSAWDRIQDAELETRFIMKSLSLQYPIDLKDKDIFEWIFADVYKRMAEMPHLRKLTPQESGEILQKWIPAVKTMDHTPLKQPIPSKKARNTVLGALFSTGMALAAAMSLASFSPKTTTPNPRVEDSSQVDSVSASAPSAPPKKVVDLENVETVWEGVHAKVVKSTNESAQDFDKKVSVAVGELLRQKMNADKVLVGKMDDVAFFERFKKELSKDGLGYAHTFNKLAPEAKTLNEMLAAPVIHKSPRLREDLRNQAAALLLSPEELAEILG